MTPGTDFPVGLQGLKPSYCFGLPKDVSVHGNKIFKAGRLLVPKDLSEQPVSQWHKTTALHAGATKLRQSLQACFVIPQLKDICKKVGAHCPMRQAQNPADYKAPGDSKFYPIHEHPFQSVCIDVFSMPALTVKELGNKGSTSTPFDAVLMCVDEHSGYIVAAPTTKEGLTGQRAAELLYRNWFTVFGPPRELISDKGSAFMSSWFKTFCHLQGVMDEW